MHTWVLALLIFAILGVVQAVDTTACHNCRNVCLNMSVGNKRAVCLRRCRTIHCGNTAATPINHDVQPMSASDFEELVHASAVHIYNELADGKIKFAREAKMGNKCVQCKKSCHGKGYKCHATCANKSFCRYEDNTIPAPL